MESLKKQFINEEINLVSFRQDFLSVSARVPHHSQSSQRDNDEKDIIHLAMVSTQLHLITFIKQEETTHIEKDTNDFFWILR